MGEVISSIQSRTIRLGTPDSACFRATSREIKERSEVEDDDNPSMVCIAPSASPDLAFTRAIRKAASLISSGRLRSRVSLADR